MKSFIYLSHLILCLGLSTFAAGVSQCIRAGRECQRHTDCCGVLYCKRNQSKGKCTKPDKYAKHWLKATTKRRKSYYRRNGISAINATVKWSNTLAEAAQNWTDFLIQQDDFQGSTDPTCYDGQAGFFKYCKLIHEGGIYGQANPYGRENLASAAGPLNWVSTKGSAEVIMQGWWDGEEANLGGHFYVAAKISSRYVGCGYSMKAVPNNPGYYCRITSCRYMSQCGTLFEAAPNPPCELCPIEGC
ncbi:hypothetical protein MPSEU_000921800 [Mayamaea pseudoterrestris]|nr:hypothetical protein MPSEU_000921800 [Mayamaea pseudoterrestris]